MGCVINTTVHVGCDFNVSAQMDAGMIVASAWHSGDLSASATLLNGGISDSVCPIIICVDGGNAFTTTYPPVNGLLNGGTP